MFLQYISGPLLGAIIGYITNDIAIRMLFRPRTAKYILGKRVPFTPGIIPKEKNRIAGAIGGAISENLMNKEVLEKTLLSDEMLEKLRNAVDEFFNTQMHNEETLEQFAAHYLTEEEISAMRESTCDKADRLLEVIATPIEAKLAQHINEVLHDQAPSMSTRIVYNESDKLLSMPMRSLFEGHEEQMLQAREGIVSVYRTIISDHLPRILESINISNIVESRIKEMDMEEAEKIILSVMKKELRAIVWLGALLGSIMGTIMTFINI